MENFMQKHVQLNYDFNDKDESKAMSQDAGKLF